MNEKSEERDVWKELAAPFHTSDVKFRVQAMSGNQALLLPYVDSRAVQNRLDSVLGVENWEDDYEEYQAPTVAIPADTAAAAGYNSYTKSNDARDTATLIQDYYQKGTLCRLRVRKNLEAPWIMKTGIADNTDIEGMKGGESQALRRAAVKYGVARYLYELNNVWIPVQLARPDGDGWEWTQYKGKDVYYRKPNLEAFGAPSSGEPVGKPVVTGGTGTVTVGAPATQSVAALAEQALAGQYSTAGSDAPPSALTPAEVQDFQARIAAVIQNNPDSLKYYKEIPVVQDSLTKVSKMLGCLYYVCAQNVPGGEHETMIRTATMSASFGDKLKTLKTVLADVEARRFK